MWEKIIFRHLFTIKLTSHFFTNLTHQHPVEPLSVQFENIKRNPNYQHNMDEMQKLLVDIKNHPEK
jgi:hypothetical protein